MMWGMDPLRHDTELVAGQAPAWFLMSTSAPADDGAVTVNGTRIHFRAWGEPGAPGLVLVHGGGAHARWWDHIGPLLAAGRRVVALDLSGHGDSGRREGYGFDLWADEVMAVPAAAGATGPPVLIGHSLGGAVVLQAALTFGAELTGIVVVDTPIRHLSPEEQAARERRAFGPPRVYRELAEALGRFRPIPAQPGCLPYVTDHIARTSLRQVSGGWTWKFDPVIFNRDPISPSQLSRLDCRVALFRAEHGLLSSEMSDVIYDRLGRQAPVIEIPEAGHHVMLDQPLSLVTGLRTLLADWKHSVPHRPAV